MRIRKVKLLLVLSLLASDAIAQQQLPRLELGAGLFALSTPNYRGSKESKSYLIPTPYIKYRGERLRVDEGAQGVIFDSETVLLTISANISLPVDDDTPEREGMEELEAIFEIGPSLNYRFYDLPDSSWWLDLPFRFAYTLDSEFENIGWVFQPRLSWRKPATRLGESKLRINFGPLFSDEEHHDYFYSVDITDALATRPAFQADGGFSGIRTEFTYSKRFGQYWLGGFVRYDNLKNSKIEDSPLVSDTDAWSAGIALSWVFLEK